MAHEFGYADMLIENQYSITQKLHKMELY